MSGTFFLDKAFLIPLVPAITFWVILLFGRRFGSRAAYIGIAALAIDWVLAVGAAAQWIHRIHGDEPAGPIIHTVTWFQSSGIKLTAGTQMDGLAVMMCFVVATISLLVHIYSFEYMRGDLRFNYFYAALSLFSASMFLLVVSSNTLQLLVGWELVGLCSFMLIGHWWEEKPNSDAALKAFLTTRTGDIGLIVGVIMTFFLVQRATGTGSFDILKVNTAALQFGKAGTEHTLLLMCAIGLMFGIIGKSGQFPLHTWLPDAMAGPTPVSALIHAATMVVAGVYLGARVYPVFWEGFQIGNSHVNFMAVIGGITVIIGAALAFVQDDIKKVLAYSTISQLGYMVMGLGVGAWTAAVFHLFTHAFFKADLFLGAGSVSHSGAHHSFDMKKDMGGLKKYMPQTFWTFVIATAALCGIFPLAGFWSKDEIIATAGKGNYQAFMIVGLFGAFLTAAYMTRCIYLTFFGEYRGGGAVHGTDPLTLADAAEATVADELHEEHLPPVVDAPGELVQLEAAGDLEPELVDHYAPGFGPHAHDAAVAHDAHDAHGDHAVHHGPHESPGLLTVPLWILTFASITAGWIQWEAVPFHIHEFHDWFQPRVAFPEVPEVGFQYGYAILSVGLALLAVAIVYAFYWQRAWGQNLSERSSLLHAGKTFLVNKYYLDWLYTDEIVGSIKGPIAHAAYWVNQNVIDNVLNYAGKGAVASADFVYRYIDQRAVDGFYNETAVVTGETGGVARRAQTGKVQEYAWAMLLGAAVIALALAIAVH